MSLITGTGVELLYANTHVGIANVSFTTEVVCNDVATMGVSARIPADFWLPFPNAVGRGIRVVARGIMKTGTATSTFQFNIRLGASQSITAPIVLGMPTATTLVASATTAHWQIEGDVILQSIGAAGVNSTVLGVGSAFFGGNNNVTGSISIGAYGGGALPATVAIDTSVTNYITVGAICSANKTNVGCTLQQLLVFGLN